MKTSDLTSAALDWAVAKCEGGTIRTEHGVFLNQGDGYEYFTPSTDWAQGGPIIEREGIGLLKVENRLPHQQWVAGETDEPPDTLWTVVSGPTPLVAAMRCYVTWKLGDEVEVPDELH